jgi:predicted anti-sigma-YlaC factor YlaD
VIARTHHLQEERIYDHYLAERCDEPADPPVTDHLADCDPCGARYAEIAEFLDGLRGEADADTDAVFTADRLRAQQVRIARRLEHVGRAARIISFPGRSAARSMVAGASRAATRWVATAAAAGLLIGVGAGMFYDSGARYSSRQSAVGRSASFEAATSVATPSTDSAEDEFMSEIEIAADRPYTLELAPFDALTPYIREVADTGR